MGKHRSNQWLLVALVAGALLAPAAAPAAVTAGDRDGDGVPDAVDNCLTSPNASQRDTDSDGFGNACDPDFNNDGLVDERDMKILTQQFGDEPHFVREDSRRSREKGHPGNECDSDEGGNEVQQATDFLHARDLDLTEDGAVDARDLKVLLSFKGKPPGPRLDTDGDGQPDLDDPCPNTRRGAPFVLRGCSSLDLVEDPNALLGPLTAFADELTGYWRPNAELSDVVGALDRSVAAIHRASSTLRAGDPCGGKTGLGEALAEIDRAAAQFPEILETARAALPRDEDFDDATLEEEALQTLTSRLEDVSNLRYETSVVTQAVGRVCAGTRSGVTFRGKVRSVRDDLGRIELTDGRLISLADPVTKKGVITEGAQIEAQGVDLGPGLGMAQNLTGDASKDQPTTSIACLFLKFLPIQRPSLPPIFPLLEHYPEGYLRNGAYEVERGTGFTVQDAGCTPPRQLGKPYFDYFMQLDVIKLGVVNGQDTVLHSLALDLRPGDAPVRIDQWFDLNWASPFLRATTLRRTCTTLGNCGPAETIETKKYALAVRERGDFCTAHYADGVFACAPSATGGTCWYDVNDQQDDPLDFRVASVDWYTYGAVDPASHFEAEAYPSDGSRQVTTIGKAGPPFFAIYRDDFYPVMPARSASAGAMQQRVAFRATGVSHPAGLQWPHVVGSRNGRSYQYSCQVPTVIRDVVNFCPNVAPGFAFYRLPFASGIEWHQGPANHEPDTSHAQYYAYDMYKGCGKHIRAMRAGRVIKAVSGYDCQNKPTNCSSDPDEPVCGSNCCTSCQKGDAECEGNQVWVRHQDQTISIYRHIKPGGVYVQEGDLVRRGELIGGMGRTGAAGGTHLHTGARAPSGGQGDTMLVLFEVVDPANPSGTLACFEPHHGNKLISNNVPF